MEPTEEQRKNAIDSKAIGFYPIKITDFLSLTTTKEQYNEILKKKHKLSPSYAILPFVAFDVKTGKVTGHEGRHRAANMYQEGKTEMLIALYPEPKHRDWKEDLSQLPSFLYGQSAAVKIPLNKKNIEIVYQNITGYDPNSGAKIARGSYADLKTELKSLGINTYRIGNKSFVIKSEVLKVLSGGKIHARSSAMSFVRKVYAKYHCISAKINTGVQKLTGTKGNYYYSAETLAVKQAGDENSDWDEQLYFRIYDEKKKLIGEAGFVYKTDEPSIWPCDDYDLAITIKEAHQRKGIGSAILKLVDKLTGREMVRSPNYHESSDAGIRLFEKKYGSDFK